MICSRVTVRGVRRAGMLAAAGVLSLSSVSAAAGAQLGARSTKSFLAGLSTVGTVASTIPSNGDENPYAVIVAPVSARSVHKTGGDLTIQACADDPQVAFHAVRELARQASGAATIRWTQAGFNETPQVPGHHATSSDSRMAP